MKRWQAMLATIGLSAGLAATEFIPGGNMNPAKVIAQGLLGSIAAYVAKKASDHNPDGTKAETAYVEDKDAPLKNYKEVKYK